MLQELNKFYFRSLRLWINKIVGYQLRNCKGTLLSQIKGRGRIPKKVRKHYLSKNFNLILNTMMQILGLLVEELQVGGLLEREMLLKKF